MTRHGDYRSRFNASHEIGSTCSALPRKAALTALNRIESWLALVFPLLIPSPYGVRTSVNCTNNVTWQNCITHRVMFDLSPWGVRGCGEAH